MVFLRPIKKPRSHSNNLFCRPKNRRLFFVLATAFFAFLFAHAVLAAPTVPSAATSALGLVGTGFAKVISFFVLPILALIVWFCALFVDIAAHLLSFMLQPNLYNFTTEQVIVYGWAIMRDICNLFFLLILLFIAFCTILQIDKYHLKKTLLTLVIMALLINFSKPIAIFIFDGSQLLMNYFLGAMKDYGTTVTALSKIAEVVYGNLPSIYVGKGGLESQAVQYLFAIIFLFMYAMALVIIAIYLLIRIVAMWIIIIVSPFAFLAMAVPDFKKMSSDWWDALFKYSYIGPAMAFFLFLSTKLGSITFMKLAKQAANEQTIIKLSALIPFLVVLTFLYASVIMAQKFGVQFASAITSRGNKIMKGAAKGVGYRMPKWAASRTGIPGGIKQKIESVPFTKRWLTKEGWKESLEDREARMAERMGVKGAKHKLQLKKAAELSKKWKDEGILDDHDELQKILRSSRNPLQRMVAARTLAKEGKLENGSDYGAGLEALRGFGSLQNEFKGNAKKKNIHAVIEYEVDISAKAGKTAPADIQKIYDEHLGKIKPTDIGEQKKLKDMTSDVYFQSFAGGHYGKNMPAGARLEMAKNLNAANAAEFKGRGWI